ncbi:unnamed protein product [Candidula unifasciata]|uniref:Uncharacterized protein n=1 Tax=Candidula unifasciata TaxID=100452 RepID=A0A8S3Z4N4_9EUPU|nr:unnamed protein product [Candidula unifasciata]
MSKFVCLEFAQADTRISVPNDLLAEASQDSDSILHSTDSDVFLADIPPEGLVCPNYVNLALEEARAAAAPPPLACQEIVLPPSHETVTNYANLTLHGPRIPKAFKQVNYIVIDHNNQSNEAVSSNVGGNAGNNSPTSPTSCMSIPESPSRKTESYAMIDFDRTVALSNATRLTEDGGTRKTRHNSTISDMP